MTKEEQRQIFEQWLERHKGLIFKVVRAFTFEAMDQDDLFQEISIQVWHSILSFKKQSSVTTWLYRISLNTSIKWSKKEKRYFQEEAMEKVQHVLQESQPADDRLTWLYDEIRKLDEIDRSITLLMLDGFSYKEMATMLGITESNVGVKINRIKKELMAKSKRYEYGL